MRKSLFFSVFKNDRTITISKKEYDIEMTHSLNEIMCQNYYFVYIIIF